MNFIPITNNKLSKDKWLDKNGKYTDNTLQDILNEFTKEVYMWINLQTDIFLVIDKDKLNKDIIEILYKNEYKMETEDNNYELFCLKYNEDIYEIFKKYYDMICIDIKIDILKNNYMIIFDYIYDNSKFYEEEEEINEVWEEEEIIF